jgi:short-subunit dehydrogenase
MNITGRKIVVTGASRGIGRATAEALARAGGRVALVARSPEVEAVAAAIVSQGGQARGYLADLGNAADVDDMARRVVDDFGPPDIMVNNAGAGRWLYVEETPVEEVVSMMAAPYFAAFYVTRAFLPAMLERGSGYIVNVNSPAAWMPWPGAAGYTAARFAMRGLSASLRLDLRGTGVRVLEMVLGKVSSSYFEHNPHTEERLPAITRLVPTLTPEQVAAHIVRGIEHNRRKIVAPFMLKLVLAMRAVAPPVVSWMMWRTGARRVPRKSDH